MVANPYLSQAKEDVGLDPAKPFAQMTWDEQQRYKQRLAQLTLAHSSELSPDQVGTARSVLDRGVQPQPVGLSIGDAVSIFGDEFVNQAEELNPLSERNRGTLAKFLMVLIGVGFIAWLFIPGKITPRPSNS